MASLALDVVTFAATAGAIVVFGSRLAADGEALEARTGWDRTWIGFIVLASVTSAPELVTGLGAAGLYGLPNLAVGNALGACAFNLLLFVVVDASSSLPVFVRHLAHARAAAYGAALLAVVALVVLLPAPAFAGVGVATPLLLAGYVVALRSMRRGTPPSAASNAAPPAPPTPSAPSAPSAPPVEAATRPAVWPRLLLDAAVVVAAALSIPLPAARLADALGLGRLFFGAFVLAFVTSLPELVVSIAAVRLRAPALAVGNLLGSNLFDLAILALDDLAYRPGAILAVASPGSLYVAAGAGAMSLVVAAAFVRPGWRRWRLTPWSAALVALYVATATWSAVLAR